MKTTVTANQIKGRAIGATFFACFGAGWIFLALATRQSLRAGAVIWLCMILLLLLGTAAWLFRQASNFQKVAGDPARGRKFMWINAIQWTAVALVAGSFAHFHLDAYTTCAITAIVGLHMFPLARLFHYPLHYATGSLLMAWAGLSAWLVPVEHLLGTAAIGTGIILLLSAWVTLVLAATLARRAPRALSTLSAA